MTNAHTKTILAKFFTLWQDRESPFSKWDFYGELFNLIEDKKITYKEAAAVTKAADLEGQGIKVDIMKMRVRDCRHGMSKTELLRRRVDRTSNQMCAWVKIVDTLRAMAEKQTINSEEAEIFGFFIAEAKAKESAAYIRFESQLKKWDNHNPVYTRY